MKILESYKQEIIEKFKNGKKCKELAIEYNVGNVTMWKFLTEECDFKFRRKKLTEEREKQFIEEYITVKPSVEALSKKYGISASVGLDYLNKNGIVDRFHPKKYNPNPDFFKIIDENTLWVLGWFYTDGNVEKDSCTCRVFVQKDDAEVLEKIKKLFGDGVITKHNDRNMCTLFLYNNKIREDLIKLGCMPAKSLIIDYPLFFTEDWQHWSFLRGVLEGDGHISLKSDQNRPGFNCEFASGSRKFLEGIQKVLKEKLGIYSNIYNKKGKGFENSKNSKKLVILGGKESIIKFLNLLYKDGNAEYYLDRKFKIYQEMYRHYYNPNPPKDPNRNRYTEGYFISPENKLYYTNCISRFGEEFGVEKTSLFTIWKRVDKPKWSRSGWSKPTQEQIDTARQNNALIEKIY